MSRLRNGIYAAIPLVILAVIVLVVFVPFHSTSLQEQEVRIAEVETGKVIRSFTGEGVVVPQSEVIILSPASSLIKGIVKEVGSYVAAGAPIIILDPTPIQANIEDLRDQLAVKQNALKKTQLSARSTRVDLDYDLQVKNLRIASLKSELADQEQLLDVGGVSPARIEKTRQELELAEQDLVMVREKNAIKLEQLETDEEGLRLQIGIQEKALDAMEEALGKMIIRAPSAGIILSIRGKVGEKVNSDQLLIEMSDLTNFKVRGKVEDDYSDQVKTGAKVYVRIDDHVLAGVLGAVVPVIRDRMIEFDVNLLESNHFKLRPNLSVNLEIVWAERDSVLRVANGPVFERGREHQVYVLTGKGPELREVRSGLKSGDYVEILEGLSEGERVVLSVVSSPEVLEGLEIR